MWTGTGKWGPPRSLRGFANASCRRFSEDDEFAAQETTHPGFIEQFGPSRPARSTPILSPNGSPLMRSHVIAGILSVVTREAKRSAEIIGGSARACRP